nr:MAG TPA: hypothetical protein [Caudoviricetes sp.]
MYQIIYYLLNRKADNNQADWCNFHILFVYILRWYHTFL